MRIELNQEFIDGITFDSAKKLYKELKKRYNQHSSLKEGSGTLFTFENPKSRSNPPKQTLKFNF